MIPSPIISLHTHHPASSRQSSAPAAEALHSAVTPVTPPLPPSPYPSSGLSTSRNSVQSWLGATSRSTSTVATTHTSQERGTQVSGRKRKRGASLEPDEASLTVPLTRKALETHLEATTSLCSSSRGNYPSTPRKGDGSLSVSTPMDSPAPPLSIASQSSLPTYTIRAQMEKHGIYRDKGILLKDPTLADFHSKVTQVVDVKRGSGVKAGSATKFKRRLEWTSDDNEATVFSKLLPYIIKDGRQVPAPLADNADNEQNYGTATQYSTQQGQDAQKLYVHEDYEGVGLQFSSDRQFAQTYLPIIFDDQGFEARVALELAKGQGIKTPKPDRIYGLALNQIAIPKGNLLRPETEKFITFVPNMKDAFFIIEGKASNGGNMTRALDQACRVGTCLVFSQRQLLAWTGHEDIEGPDERTYVYSATMDADCMFIWVHFAVVDVLEDGSKDINFHMEYVYSKTYRENDALLYLRRVCHNILDWGVGARKQALGERYKEVIEYDGRLMKDAALRSHVEGSTKAEEQQAKKKKLRKNDGTSVTTSTS